MLIVEFGLDSPVLNRALERSPDVTVRTEEIYRTPDGEIRFLFWAEGEDVDAFETALAGDPTVTNPSLLTAQEAGRLYRVDFTERGSDGASFPVWSELDVALLETRGSHEGWQVRMRFPHRESLAAFRDHCRQKGLGFDLHSVYDEADRTPEIDAGLSTDQRSALVTAFEAGYFEIPREASLADVADRLGISSQAASERLRRGVSTIVERSIVRGRDTP